MIKICWSLGKYFYLVKNVSSIRILLRVHMVEFHQVFFCVLR